ncbi:glycosyltransferase family 4 protein [Patescibacteria group bacterium]|nr:glycosyltransferase family 4 protein [Patescibacteria group bacterium]
MKGNTNKILVFSTAYYPFVGGAEVAIKEITDHLYKDFQFDLITARFDKNLPYVEKVGKVTVYRLGSGKPKLDKLLLPFRGAILAWKLTNKEKYYCLWAVMVTFGSGAGFILNICRKLSGKGRIPIVLTLQEGDSENHLQYKWAGLIALSWKLALRSTDLLTGISNFLIDRAKKNGYRGNAVLVPNGVDLSIFSQEIKDSVKKDLLIKLDKKPDDIFLVTAGRLTHKNAIDDVVSALVTLPKNVVFIVIGKGDEGVNLQAQARKLGVADRVKFLGFIPYEDIPKYFSISDIFIRPSRSEGFGNSFIEAMAAGLPVIATPVGGIVDFIDDCETGVFCSPDNPQSISKAVMTLSGDFNLKSKIIENAKNRVRERYGWDKIALEMKNVFDRLA